VAPRKLFDAHFWVPLIAMYTGMRVGEICQLQISDIHTEGMRWHGRVFTQPYIQVCAEHESQRVKNQNATRKVPIHHRLIEVGFLDYVELRKREARGNADQRLFRHMRYESHSKWGRVITRWFNGDGEKKADGYKHRVLDQQALEGKVFHSFRHTVIDIFRSTLGASGKPIISAMIGHEEEGSSAAYGDGYQLDQLSQAMDTLRYSDEVEALVSRLRFDDYVQKMIRHGMEGSERNTRIRWPKKNAVA
jgi:integrase